MTLPNKFNKPISPGKFYRIKADPRSVMVGRLLRTAKFSNYTQTLERGGVKRIHNFTLKQPIVQLSTGYRLGNYVYRKEVVYRRTDGLFTPIVQYMRVPAVEYSPLDVLLETMFNDDPIRMLPHESEQTGGW